MSIECSLKKIRYEKRSASTKVVRNGEQEFLDAHTANSYNNSVPAGVAELADAADLKSAGEILVGSSPTLGTSSPRLTISARDNGLIILCRKYIVEEYNGNSLCKGLILVI